MRTTDSEAGKGRALVTGAGGGIGRAIAGELAARGYGLILTDISEPALVSLADELEKRFPGNPGGCPDIIPLDLTAEGGGRKLCAMAPCPVSVLVNCAGVYANIEDEWANPDCAVKLLTLHVTALTELCLFFGEAMARAGGGHILNLSSISSLFHDPSSMTYGASKNYVRFFSRSLGLELRERGVLVSCLMPGGVDTKFFANNNVTLPAMVRRGLISPELCAKLAVEGMFKGKRTIMPGASSRMQALLFRTIVRPVLYGLVKKVYGRMKQEDAG